MNSHDAALLRCAGCGWTIRGWDIPEGVTVDHVMGVHRQGSCGTQATHWQETAAAES